MTIALDAAAGDRGLAPNISGAVAAADAVGSKLVLVGPAADIRTALAARAVAPGDPRFEIVDCPEVIGMGDEPAAACRARPRASIMACAELVARGAADALVSAGNPGASVIAALWQLKRLPEVLRPALAFSVPTPRGTTVLIDGGANTECKPWHLLQFAMMGTLYAQEVHKIPEPSVGILSSGPQEYKGGDMVREAIPLIKSSGLRYAGPVEGRDIAAGTTDVVVCDGFVGDVAVKAVEGTAAAMITAFDGALTTPLQRVGARLLRGALGSMRAKFDFEGWGAAPLLGVGGIVIVAPSRPGGKVVANAIRLAGTLAANGICGRLCASMETMRQTMQAAPISAAP